MFNFRGIWNPCFSFFYEGKVSHTWPFLTFFSLISGIAKWIKGALALVKQMINCFVPLFQGALMFKYFMRNHTFWLSPARGACFGITTMVQAQFLNNWPTTTEGLKEENTCHFHLPTASYLTFLYRKENGSYILVWKPDNYCLK